MDPSEAAIASRPAEEHAADTPIHEPTHAPIPAPPSPIQAPPPTAPAPVPAPAEPDAPMPTPRPLTADATHPRIEALAHGLADARPRSRARTRTPRPGTPGDTANAAATMATQAQGGGDRPLNVTDALGYLDNVKLQFQDKPDVYNHFLDIMKDFKSQLIDTPGVIERVSMLFQGNPDLIQGFNTFLPPGYHIQCSQDASRDATQITVTTPLGTITQTGGAFNPIRIPRATDALPPPPPPAAPPAPQFGSGLPHPLPPVGTGVASRATTPLPLPAFHLPHLQGAFAPGPAPLTPGAQSTSHAASLLGNLNVHARGTPATQQTEFNHAIHYLNQIKTRFADQPDTYKQFLEILQAYQKDQRAVQHSQVHAQVQILFREAPDLLEEFKAFLPRPDQDGPGPLGMMGMPHPVMPAPAWTEDPSRSALAEPAEPSRAASKRKRRPEPEPEAPPPKASSSRTKKPRNQHALDPHSPPSPRAASPGPSYANGHAQNGQLYHPAPQHPAPAPLPPMPVPHPGQPRPTPDHVLFFEHVKKLLSVRDAYDDFLRLLNLYTNDVVDTKTLIRRAERFLGDGELLNQFKDIMGWDEHMLHANRGPPGSIRANFDEKLVPRAEPYVPRAEEGQGPSYRRLQASEVHLACSGRAELERSVLNDHWVSHPTWGSEDAGFQAHKKNTFEEALHRCEEERYEFAVHLQGLSRTLAVLEPLAQRIEEMDAAERIRFKLRPDLGGPAQAIYVRTLKRVYGARRGDDVHRALQDFPSAAVPVVLRRLKDKDDEWRAVQRDWGRTWREVDHRNFYKSVDHQGIALRAEKKKALTIKQFVADIRELRDDAAEERTRPRWACGAGGAHMAFALADADVLRDAVRVVFAFLAHAPAQYSSAERRGLEAFLRRLVPLLCVRPPAEFDLPGSTRRASSSPREMSVDGGGSDAGASDVPAREEAAPEEVVPEMWVQEDTASVPEGVDLHGQPLTHVPLFVNTTFYALVRLLQRLYSILLMCKEFGAKLATENYASLKPNPIAVELGLEDGGGPADVLKLAQAAFNSAGDAHANVVYAYTLDALDKVFAGDMDPATFEEHMRWFFGDSAYHMFGPEKMVLALIKQAQTVLGDNRSHELWELMQRARALPAARPLDVIRYRREAEDNVSADDHLYRFDWDPATSTLGIRLMGDHEPSVDGGEQPAQRWREYVASYVSRYPTEWQPRPKAGAGRPFLRRNLADGPAPGRCDLRVRVSLGSYRLFYAAGSEDVLVRARPDGDDGAAAAAAQAQDEARRRVWETKYR